LHIPALPMTYIALVGVILLALPVTYIPHVGVLLLVYACIAYDLHCPLGGPNACLACCCSHVHCRQPAVKEITVVNISSISATQPYEAFGVYAAGKVRSRLKAMLGHKLCLARSACDKGCAAFQRKQQAVHCAAFSGWLPHRGCWAQAHFYALASAQAARHMLTSTLAREADMLWNDSSGSGRSAGGGAGDVSGAGSSRPGSSEDNSSSSGGGRREAGPSDRPHIKCISYSPGPIDTDMQVSRFTQTRRWVSRLRCAGEPIHTDAQVGQ